MNPFASNFFHQTYSERQASLVWAPMNASPSSEFNHSTDLLTMSPWHGSGGHQQIKVSSPCFAISANRFSSAYTSPCSKIRSHSHRQ